MFRAGHLNSDVLKGIEGEAMAELGVTKAGQRDLPKAHTTTGKAVTGDIVGATTAKEAIEGMREGRPLKFKANRKHKLQD